MWTSGCQSFSICRAVFTILKTPSNSQKTNSILHYNIFNYCSSTTSQKTSSIMHYNIFNYCSSTTSQKTTQLYIFNYCSSTAQIIAKICFRLDKFSKHSSYSDMNKQLKAFTWINLTKYDPNWLKFFGPFYLRPTSWPRWYLLRGEKLVVKVDS